MAPVLHLRAWLIPLLAMRTIAFSRIPTRKGAFPSLSRSSLFVSEVEVPSAGEDETANEVDECPRGYYLDSVTQQCARLGPLGRISQVIEMWGPLKTVSTKISGWSGVGTHGISSSGVGFVLSYAILSNINGAFSLSCAWYLTCRKTGLSPLVPGQWKSLLGSYGSIYVLLQVVRPFRVAAAVAMSKLSKELLEQTQERFKCSRAVAIIIQYAVGWVAWAAIVFIGIGTSSLATGVPIY